MKVINWKRDYFILGIVTLSISVLLFIRKLLFGNFSTILGIIDLFFFPLMGFYVSYRDMTSDGPRFSMSEACFLILVLLYCGLYILVSTILDLIFIPGMILNLSLLTLNIMIISLAWSAIFYYSY